MGHSESKPKGDQVQYDVTVYTGAKKYAGTSSSVFVTLHGDKGVSAELKLHHNSSDDFSKGHVSTHPLYTKDIGNLWKLEIWKDDSKDEPGHWLLEKVIVQLKPVPDALQKQKPDLLKPNEKGLLASSGIMTLGRSRSKSRSGKEIEEKDPNVTKTWTFPCYRWVDEREELWEGTSILPQQETNQDRLIQRKDEIEKMRGRYQWKRVDGLPTYIRSKFATLPFDEQWTEEKLEDFLGPRHRALANFGLDKFLEVFQHWTDFEDYTELFKLIPVPPLQQVWREDETFGRLRLQGVNPSLVRRVTTLPIPNFPVTTEMVAPLLPSGTTLESLTASNKLYYVDLSFFAEYDSVECLKEGRGIACPMALFFVNPEDKFMPLAIMLRTSTPYDPETNPIFTPLDPEPEWLLAKMFYANADGMQHQIQAHLMGTHLVTEPMVIAMHRNLPSCHPVYKLLLPHFKYQLGINARARELMINNGGSVDLVLPLKHEILMEAAKKAFKQWRFDRVTFPMFLKTRDITENPSDLPEYYARDDGKLIWECIHSYVEELMSGFYPSDDDVRRDTELQSWLAEVVDIGFSGEDKGFPRTIAARAELVETLTTILWTVSALHALLNFSQYETYGFVPASPGSIFMYPIGHPKSTWVKGKLTFKQIFDSLPPKSICVIQIAMTYVLSQYSSEDNMLGQYPETYFTEEITKTALENYRKNLSRVADKINERGVWDHLLPNKIPNATAV